MAGIAAIIKGNLSLSNNEIENISHFPVLVGGKISLSDNRALGAFQYVENLHELKVKNEEIKTIEKLKGYLLNEIPPTSPVETHSLSITKQKYKL